MTRYYRPVLQSGTAPNFAIQFKNGRHWIIQAVEYQRNLPAVNLPVSELPTDLVASYSAVDRSDAPKIMGILNVTPDSFSDGGHHNDLTRAVSRARKMVEDGADILDIGGESTRPGADFVPLEEEIARTVPVIEALRAEGIKTPISIDTRKAAVAEAALQAGANIFNDVTALSYDADSLRVARDSAGDICLMHAAGDPKTMQENPNYADVLLDVYDYLASRIEVCMAAGIDQNRIIVDPGIGFGKTLHHNLELLNGLSLFHSLGCTLLLGASRKKFIGTLSNETDATKRVGGSVAVALDALNHGVQIVRVHDVKETKQAFDLWSALHPRQE